MDKKHTFKAGVEGILNNYTEPNVYYTTMKIELCEKDFDCILKTIKAENYSLFHDEPDDLEYSDSLLYNSIDNKNKKQQQDEMFELAFTSHEKDVNVSESYLQECTDTKLVGGKIVSVHTSYPSTAIPITKILSPKSKPHICLKHCFKCKNNFRLLDSPLHISRIRSIDKQNEFLKIEPTLCNDSCLCEVCWKYLEKTYKSNKSKNRKEESYSEKNYRLLECYRKKDVSKKRNQARKCSIHSCPRRYRHKMSVNECENIKKLFLTLESCLLVFVESTKQTTDILKFPFGLCKIHNDMIMVMSTCQICGDKLNAQFNTDDWHMHEVWNSILIENNLPLILKPGMFICVTCKGNISKTTPGFPTFDLPHLQEYILKKNAICLKLYGEFPYNLFNKCLDSTCVASPIVAKDQEEKECVRSTTVKCSDPLITKSSNSEIFKYKNDTETIASTAILNVAEQNLCKHNLEPKGEVLDFVQLEEEHFKTFTDNKPKDQLFNFYTDLTPNTSGIEMTYKSIDDQLKNYDNKISKNEEINQYQGIFNDNSLQNLCQVDNVEIDENGSEIISCRQTVSGHNEIEIYQNKLNSHTIICSVARDGSSMNLKEDDQCTNEINTNHKSVHLNETDNSMNSFIAAVELPDAIIYPCLIKRKQGNVICDTAFNKDVKRQRLNEKYSSYDNNFTDDDMTSDCKNKDDPNSDCMSDLTIDLEEDVELNTNMPSNHIENVLLDEDISDSDAWSDSIISSDSETNGEEILPDCEETDYIIVDSDTDLTLDSDC